MRSGRAPNVPTEPVPPPSQGLGRDPQPRGYIPPTPIRSPRFSNYPEAVPGPPAALRAALLSPEKCQGRNALRGGGRKERVPWDFVVLPGDSGHPAVLFLPEGTVTGGEGTWQGGMQKSPRKAQGQQRTQLIIDVDETHLSFHVNDTRSGFTKWAQANCLLGRCGGGGGSWC